MRRNHTEAHPVRDISVQAGKTLTGETNVGRFYGNIRREKEALRRNASWRNPDFKAPQDPRSPL